MIILDKTNFRVNVLAIVYESEWTNFLLERAYYLCFVFAYKQQII